METNHVSITLYLEMGLELQFQFNQLVLEPDLHKVMSVGDILLIQSDSNIFIHRFENRQQAAVSQQYVNGLRSRPELIGNSTLVRVDAIDTRFGVGYVGHISTSVTPTVCHHLYFDSTGICKTELWATLGNTKMRIVTL